MKAVIRWSLIVGFIWALLYIALYIALGIFPDQGGYIQAGIANVIGLGQGLANFVRPAIQLALILLIVIEAAKHVGILPEGKITRISGLPIFDGSNVQAYLAVMIVISVTIGALGYGEISTLKDLALVVLGFYFGSKRSQVEADAIAAGVALGTSGGLQPPPHPSQPIPEAALDPNPDNSGSTGTEADQRP